MSLIDTWASTGAGAFSLSENGLYTTEAWNVVLARLTPTGVFSVSRWFAPGHISETNRLLALGTAALLARGVPNPKAHLLLSRGTVATLLASPSPFTAADRATIEKVASDEAFTVQVSPWTASPNAELDRIAGSTTRRGCPQRPRIRASTTARRPTTGPSSSTSSSSPASRIQALPDEGVVRGNIYATTTLVVLFGITSALVALPIVGPLVAHGRPRMPGATFAASLIYFAGIGLGFMLVQMALLQRFSIYLGHPTYTLSITLFSMILFAGIGSYLSDRVVASLAALEWALPLAATAGLLLLLALVPVATHATIGYGLGMRSAVVVGAPRSACRSARVLLSDRPPAGRPPLGRSDGVDVGGQWRVQRAGLDCRRGDLDLRRHSRQRAGSRGAVWDARVSAGGASKRESGLKAKPTQLLELLVPSQLSALSCQPLLFA